MKFEKAFNGVKRVFLDTAPVIYYVERNAYFLSTPIPLVQRIRGMIGLVCGVFPFTVIQSGILTREDGIITQNTPCTNPLIPLIRCTKE